MTGEDAAFGDFGQTVNAGFDAVALCDGDMAHPCGGDIDFEAVRVGGFGATETRSAGRIHRLLLHLTGGGAELPPFEEGFKIVTTLEEEIFDSENDVGSRILEGFTAGFDEPAHIGGSDLGIRTETGADGCGPFADRQRDAV